MNADAFRQLYDYHFNENRILINYFISQLTDEQFTQDASHNNWPVRHQIVHLLNVDNGWFGGLRKVAHPEELDDENASREQVKAHRLLVEKNLRGYLDKLRDEMLFEKPLTGEDTNMALWQVLIHVVNHGTDHRAQIYKGMNEMGIETKPQDFAFYLYEQQDK